MIRTPLRSVDSMIRMSSTLLRTSEKVMPSCTPWNPRALSTVASLRVAAFSRAKSSSGLDAATAVPPPTPPMHVICCCASSSWSTPNATTLMFTSGFSRCRSAATSHEVGGAHVSTPSEISTIFPGWPGGSIDIATPNAGPIGVKPDWVTPLTDARSEPRSIG